MSSVAVLATLWLLTGDVCSMTHAGPGHLGFSTCTAVPSQFYRSKFDCEEAKRTLLFTPALEANQLFHLRCIDTGAGE